MSKEKLNWQSAQTLGSKSYICGYCNKPIASEKGYWALWKGSLKSDVYICHYCSSPTFFDIRDNTQTPGQRYGNIVEHVPQEISDLYNEARECTSCNSYTAAVLCCRKLLMNIAVSKGAKEGLKFIEYVNFLTEKGFVPPDSNEWIDHIRNKGNEANHEIKLMDAEDAQELIGFIEMILKFIFEFPAIMKNKV
jgi:hypothetical protein